MKNLNLVIVGGGAGLGALLAEMAVADGAAGIGIIDINAEAAEAALASARAKGLKAAAAACDIPTGSSIRHPSSNSASGRLGVITVASGSNRVRSASSASASSRRAPLVATITGSTTTCGGRWRSSARATASITPALASMPSLTAPMRKSSKQASICASRKPVGGRCTAVTPRVCWAVSAASADRPCTPWAAKVFRSAWMPAPPPESEPAMVRALSGRGSVSGSCMRPLCTFVQMAVARRRAVADRLPRSRRATAATGGSAAVRLSPRAVRRCVVGAAGSSAGSWHSRPRSARSKRTGSAVRDSARPRMPRRQGCRRPGSR